MTINNIVAKQSKTSGWNNPFKREDLSNEELKVLEDFIFLCFLDFKDWANENSFDSEDSIMEKDFFYWIANIDSTRTVYVSKFDFSRIFNSDLYFSCPDSQLINLLNEMCKKLTGEMIIEENDLNMEKTAKLNDLIKMSAVKRVPIH